MNSLAHTFVDRSKSDKADYGLLYLSLVLFEVIYFARPNDWIPGVGTFPFAKVSGSIALLLFLFVAVSKAAAVLKRLNATTFKLLLALFVQICLSIPFSIWRGGSISVAWQFANILVIGAVIVTAVSTRKRLEVLLAVQTLCVGVGAVLALGNYTSGRLEGTLGGTFSNPNDFALNLALIVPMICYFAGRANSVTARIIAAGAIGLIAYVVILTSSRGGFIALCVALLFLGRDLIWRAKKRILAVLTLATCFLAIALMPSEYRERLGTSINTEADETGSAQARKGLLMLSIETTFANPIFGVGAGNFPIVSGGSGRRWQVAHNTYTELSAENGLPAMVLFIALLFAAFSRLQKADDMDDSAKGKLIMVSLRASIAAFVAGAVFADFAYHFFPYLLISYAGVLPDIQAWEKAARENKPCAG